jgi:hypothetical protein
VPVILVTWEEEVGGSGVGSQLWTNLARFHLDNKIKRKGWGHGSTGSMLEALSLISSMVKKLKLKSVLT